MFWLIVGLIVGAILVKLFEDRTPREAAPPGILAGNVSQFKNAAASECWYCGDYQCVTAPEDSSYSVGDKTRICGPRSNPRWSGSCPSTTTLGDGSSWQFKDDCRCDG